MIQPQTRLKVADNTGAKQIMCIRVLAHIDAVEIWDVIVARKICDTRRSS